MWNNLYQTYRNRTFTEIFPTDGDFVSEYMNAGIPPTVSAESAKVIYYLIYSRWGNDTIASSDENRFKYNVWSIIFSYGPAWEKRLELQKAIRELNIEDLQKGNTMILNHSYNPGTAPSTQTLDELTAINEQNTQKQKRDLANAYMTWWSMIDTDVTEQFLSKFRKLFNMFGPEIPILYEEDNND